VSVLDRILESKREEVAKLRPRATELERAARGADAPRGFARALQSSARPRVIAEFKRASPSKGRIREHADPAAIAKGYAAAGAAALSVLTDGPFFSGSIDDLQAARAAVSIPVLRKDFTIDPLQVIEARAIGADAVLLIVAALDDAALAELLAAAHEQGLDVLVEVHTRAELERALAQNAGLIGVNNRDLGSFRTDVGVTRELLRHARGARIVSESGLDSPEVIRELESHGAAAFLIGEALMRAADPGAELARLRGAG
jgi:indole-3-glycerol phosphate synthase